MLARLPLTLLACASVLALSACKDDQPPAPAAYDYASAAPALVNLNAPAGYDGYAPAERAHAFDRVAYEVPPSYGFRYGDEDRWAWRTADDYSMYVEPYDDGYRTYYYGPGDDYPYFIRDDDYGYGYGPDGALVAVYDSYGVLLPEDRLYVLAAVAGSYLLRATAIRGYALDDRYRMPVTEIYWSTWAPRYYGSQQVWYAAPEREPLWREWRARNETQSVQFIPRGQVLRWSKADNRAWKDYEKVDRKAWKEEDKAWRKSGRQVALAAPTQASRETFGPRQERADARGAQRREEARFQRPAQAEVGDRGHAGRKADRLEMAATEPGRTRADDRPMQRQPQAQIERQRSAESRDHGRTDRKAERVQMATAEPRPAAVERPQAPRAAPQEREGRRQPQIARAEPPAPAAAPPREHGGPKHAAPAQQAQAAPAAPQEPRQRGGGGKPDRGSPPAAAAAPQGQPAQAQGGAQANGDKPEGNKGHGKGKE
jgi:hypothetical protein